MKGLRVLELSEALNVDSSDLLAVCAILKFKATSRLSMLSFEECKKITDYYDNNKKTNISNSSAEDIFGDEQTFPFVAGLGKNAAH